MMPALLQRMLPPELLDIYMELPKGGLTSGDTLKRGEKRLIETQVASAHGTVINEDLWHLIPASADTEELLILNLSVAATCTGTQRNRLTEILHRQFPNPLLLFIHHGGSTYLSARYGEHIIRVLLPDSLPPAFVADMDICHGFPAHLRALYNRWLCALYALRLCTDEKLLRLVPHIAYSPESSPAEAEALNAQLNSLINNYSATVSELKDCTQPGRRVDLGKRKHELKEQLLSLIPALP